MGRSCRLVRAGRSVEAAWRRDGDVLIVSPAGSPPLALPLAEVSGIGGDGYTVRLSLPEGEVALERLGGDGPTLLEELRRDWPALRAAVLRLSAGERPAQVFAGSMKSPGGNGPFRGFVLGDRLIVAPEGRDVLAIFVADFASVAFDEGAYAVRMIRWGGEEVVFSRLGGATAALAAGLRSARGMLARHATEVVAAHLPTLAPAARATSPPSGCRAAC